MSLVKNGKNVKVRFILGLLALALCSMAFAATPDKPMSVIDCLKCHDKKISSAAYFNSSHKELVCTACHIRDSKTLTQSIDKKKCPIVFKGIDCARCHEKAQREYVNSVHNSKRLPVTCWKCHAEIHSIQSHKTDKLKIAEDCSACHTREKAYFSSQHRKGLEQGHVDAATCTDCHGMHAIAKIDKDSKGRVFATKACLQCHADKEKMKRNKVTPIAGETYFNSYHGKNVRLGYPEKVAGCADCHGAHGIKKPNDPTSSIHPDNLIKTCAKCHADASAPFTRYITHAEDHDRQKYPSLYWTRIAMTGLLIGTFLFFGLHTILWAFRAFVEKHEKGLEQSESHIKNAKKIYRRFKIHHIILHILVVVSFLGLSLTGLPIKFSTTSWGKVLIDFMGGTQRASFIHHVCAVITFVYFFTAIAMSIRFLFIDKNQKGSFWDKLLGPDSLCPNIRDLQDLIGMFKWFFFLGPKPRFERWTYWEKFDFLAVFWGMFAIGSSGLMLWFPEFFGKFLPGWAFNIATIIHSDEALLATGFIFTVHFFNTHFRPEKFPMDFVIFNGQISKEEMMEERGDQWQRYEAEGRTEEFAVEKPSSLLWDFSLKAFGFLAVVIGLSLAIGIITALIYHS